MIRSLIGSTLNTGRRKGCDRDAGETGVFPSSKYHWGHERAPSSRTRPPLGDAHLRRAFRRPALNELYRGNLAKGQTGLSIAFDLPTQTGYDPDHILARGEVGKVGVSVAHRGDMETLLDQIPLDTMNTSMTINATAAWLLGLYAAVAEEQGVPLAKLSGTTQNDIIKEYLSRGTYAFRRSPRCG